MAIYIRCTPGCPVVFGLWSRPTLVCGGPRGPKPGGRRSSVDDVPGGPHHRLGTASASRNLSGRGDPRTGHMFVALGLAPSGGGGTGAEKLFASVPFAAYACKKQGMSSFSSFWSSPVVGTRERAFVSWWFSPYLYLTSKSNSAKRSRHRSRRRVAHMTGWALNPPPVHRFSALLAWT